MITEDKIKVYKRYDGDIDGWARSGSKKEKSIMSDEDWYVIDGLIQDLSMVKKGLASSGFNENLNVKLKEMCDSDSTVNQLQKLASI
ncbi:MAG: hypothetical protein R2796_07650 [Chitinophagaceae bacterium]|nr:hypothetical protein [Chitinophagaceae bacterium]